MRKIKSWGFKILRAVAVLLSLTLDVKVRADVIFKEIRGEVEIQKARDSFTPVPLSKAIDPLSIDTFKDACAKLSFGESFVGLAEESLLDLEVNQSMTLYRGQVFVSVKNSRSPLTLKTVHGSLSFLSADFILNTDKEKTSFMVTKGEITLLDRASGKTQQIKAGYGKWIGGLLASGRHSAGELEPLNFVEVIGALRSLSLFSSVEIQGESDRLKPLIKTAVETVAENYQKDLESDLKNLGEYQKNKREKDARQARARADLQRYYREKTLGIPGDDVREPASLVPK